MAGERGVLVGRDAELAALDGLLAEACSGQARAVFVSGEPGIGKTFVLAELSRRAEERNCLVLEGSAAEFEQELPFGVVIDALDDYVRSLGRPVVERLAADGLTELAEVFPSLRGLRTATERPPAAAERFQTYYAVRELLERLAARQPLVLVLDDLHWADGASLELVAHLLRRPPDAPVLVAGTFRPGQVDSALVAAVEGATRSGAAARVPLGPLTPADAAKLVGANADRLYRQSGGNPFYLLQLARSGTGAAPAAAGGDDGVAPPAVTAAIAAELAALTPVARSFAEAAAVVGDPFDLDLSAAAAAVSELDALSAVDSLVARDLVRPAAVPRRFAFRHPLVRSAVYQAASVGTRLAAHARCADALAARGAPATVRAHHVERSARHGDSAAIEILLEAGRANVHRLPSAAVRWFQAALRLLPDDAPPEDRIEVLVALADSLGTVGQLPEARAALVDALVLAPAGQRRMKLIAGCASIEQQLGLHAESHDRLAAALDDLTDRQSEAGVAITIALAIDGFYQMQFEAMERWGTSAVAAAEEVGSPLLGAAASAMMAFGCAFTGSSDKAKAHADAAARVLDALPDDHLEGRVEAVAQLAAAELYLERFEETAVHARRGIEMARAQGQIHVYPTLFPCLGTSSWVLGRLAESAEVLDGAIESARLTANAQSIAWSLFNRALCSIVAGDLDYALRLSEESVELASQLGDTFVASYAGVILGWALLEAGDLHRALDVQVRAGGGDDLAKIAGGWRATHLGVLARTFLALGRVDDARVAAERARGVADQVGLPRTTAMAHLAGADVALHEGDGPVAVDEARAAVVAAEQASAWYDVATARAALGRALALAGETAGAVAELEQAAADFDRFGASRWRDRAEHELRRLGQRVHRRSHPATSDGTSVTALSGRELEVARLVVDRRTNPEIAADLFLSLKTVETHMRNIFRKLDVSSRVDVARVLERAGPR